MSEADGIDGKVVSCPTCSAMVAWSPASRWRPFCSERCRLIDLGQWFDEQHRIPAQQELLDKTEPVD